LKSLGGGELGFLRFGADIGDGAFLFEGMRERTTGECLFFSEELRDFGRSILWVV
jgi:hypothetical protein